MTPSGERRVSAAALRIDLNSDVGESFGAWAMGSDEDLIPLVTSVNVACGAHAGDPVVMARTVQLARTHGAAIGAHPGYPDLAGFGRRDIVMDRDELEAWVLYQIGALAAFARADGAELRHVKPHGALYNRAAVDRDVAASIVRAVRRYSGELVFVGLAGSVMLDVAAGEGLRTAAEAFADRAYESDGTLRSRRLPDAVLPDPATAAEQAVAIVGEGRVRAHDGTLVSLHADTLCIHGDTPSAVDYARAVRDALESAGVDIRSVSR